MVSSNAGAAFRPHFPVWQQNKLNTVLVIDDDENYRELVVIALQDDCGAEVLAFGAGHQLLEHLARPRREPVGLVLLDLHMPGMNGLELMSEIRRLDERVPIAVLSGAAEPEERAACLAAGACAFVEKPVAYANLIRALQELVTSPAVRLSRCGSPS
jgi:two-component system sensor histidine kinase RpfC